MKLIEKGKPKATLFLSEWDRKISMKIDLNLEIEYFQHS